MKTYLLSIIFVLFASSCFAQATELSLHKVYLKNGSILKGEIEKQEDGIKLFIVGGDEVFISKDKIDTIEPFLSGFLFFNDRRCLRVKGKYFSARYQFGGDFYGPQIGYHFIAGYYPKPKIGLGIGIGWTNIGTAFQSFRTSRVSKVPITVNAKWFFNTRKISPYWISDIGWAFAVNPSSYYNYYKGNLFSRTGIGVRLATRKRHSLLVELGFAGHLVKYSYTSPFFSSIGSSPITNEYKGLVGRVALNFGLIF